MTDRRSFVSSVSAAGLWLSRPEWLGASSSTLRVNANPTVFFSHPEGRANLVRFEVSGIDAPAGRLRVFDRSRRLLGTAGMLRSGDRLYGELWIELERTLNVVSELEAPGVRGPYRTNHRLAPDRLWTIHVLTLADADAVSELLYGMRPAQRAIQTAILRDSLVAANALSTSRDISGLDHIPFLRMGNRALEVERGLAIPMGSAAYVPRSMHVPRTGALALAGNGVRVIVRENQDSQPFEWWDVPGGNRMLVVSLPQGSTPSDLGFHSPANEMTAHIEEWLSSTGLRFSTDDSHATAVVLNTNVTAALPATLEAVSSWNARYAYPRIVLGDTTALFEEMESRALDARSRAPEAINEPQEPEHSIASSTTELRQAQTEARTRDLASVLCGIVEPSGMSLDRLGSYVATAVPGSLVFNPSPYAHSDLVRMSDGTERIASNVPGLGYAFFPDESVTGEAGRWEPINSTSSADGQALHATINEETGAISSLMQLADGREWVRQDSAGLNALDGARVEEMNASRLDAIATRIALTRRIRGVGVINTTVTLFDELPWLSVENRTDFEGVRALEPRFHFLLQEPRVSWEVPAGYDEAELPIPTLSHLRWIRLADQDGSLMFRGLDAPVASVDADGTLSSHAPVACSRYRIALLSRYAGQDMPWVFGWDSEPMTVARAEPNGTELLPRYGSLLHIEQVGVSALGLMPATDGLGAVLYLQETLGVSRSISVSPGVIGFRYAELVDYLERHLEEITVDSSRGIEVPVPAYGIVAVRLSGLDVN